MRGEDEVADAEAGRLSGEELLVVVVKTAALGLERSLPGLVDASGAECGRGRDTGLDTVCGASRNAVGRMAAPPASRRACSASW